MAASSGALATTSLSSARCNFKGLISFDVDNAEFPSGSFRERDQPQLADSRPPRSPGRQPGGIDPCGPSSTSPFVRAVSVENICCASNNQRGDRPIQEFETSARWHLMSMIFRRRVSGHENKQREACTQDRYAKAGLIPCSRNLPETFIDKWSQRKKPQKSRKKQDHREEKRPSPPRLRVVAGRPALNQPSNEGRI